jgi:hypothetical protein
VQAVQLFCSKIAAYRVSLSSELKAQLWGGRCEECGRQKRHATKGGALEFPRAEAEEESSGADSCSTDDTVGGLATITRARSCSSDMGRLPSGNRASPGSTRLEDDRVSLGGIYVPFCEEAFSTRTCDVRERRLSCFLHTYTSSWPKRIDDGSWIAKVELPGTPALALALI